MHLYLMVLVDQDCLYLHLLLFALLALDFLEFLCVCVCEVESGKDELFYYLINSI